MRPSRACAFVFLAAALSMEPAVASENKPEVVGAVGAAAAAPTGKAPGASTRVLISGSDVFFRDRIATKRGGMAQIAFMDRSTLSVGENSTLVIDEFVYRPGKAGAMTASLARGMLRYVGGEISHAGGTTIKTPASLIGIRGGIALIGALDTDAMLRKLPGVPRDFHKGTVVVDGYGEITIRNARTEVVLKRPGLAVFVGSFDEKISAPVQLDALTLRAFTQQWTPAAGQRAGRPIATDASPPAARGEPLRTARADQPFVGNPLSYTSIFSVGNALTRNRAQERQLIGLQQALQQPLSAQAATGTASNGVDPSNTGPIPLTGSRSNSSPQNRYAVNGSGSGGTPSSPPLSGTVTAHDITAGTVVANTIYVHDITAHTVTGTIHLVNGNGNGNGGSNLSEPGAQVQGATINAHDITATTVSATDIYAHAVNYD